MITKIQAFTDSNGNTYGTLVAAQKAELEIVFAETEIDLVGTDWSVGEIAAHIIEKQDKIIDILTTTPSSKPKARKINGGTKTRAPKKHIAEQFPLPMEDASKPAA